MGRAIAFDLDQALDAAMRTFWKGGYAATSLQDLLDAMELGSGSFYNTLKSKKQLFLQILERYSVQEVQRRMAALTSAPTAAAGVRAMYKVFFDALDDPETPSRLCLMASLISPEVLDDPDMRRIAEAQQIRATGVLADLIRRDIRVRLISKDADPDLIASVIATFGQGMMRVALICYDRDQLERQTETLLTSLGLPPPH